MSARTSICAVALGAALLLGLAPRATASTPQRVVYAMAGDPDSPSALSAPLLKSELDAAGFNVVLMETRGARDRHALRALAEGEGRVASMTVEGRGRHLTARVWLMHRTKEGGLLREVKVQGRGAESVRLLAVKVAELLHANVLELEETLPERHERHERHVDAREAEPQGARSIRDTAEFPPWALAAGPMLLGGPGGVPLGVAPLLLLSYGFDDRWSVELGAAGPVIGSVSSAVGTATLDQEMVLARGRVSLPDRSWSPHLVVGLGMYRVGAQGAAAAPYAGESTEEFVAIGTTGIGVRWNATRNLRLLTEVDAGLVAPRPVIRFADQTTHSLPSPVAFAAIALELAW